MVLVLVKGTNTLTVHYEHLERWLSNFSLNLKRLVPDPQTLLDLRIEANDYLCARVDSGSHTKTLVLRFAQDDPVQQERLACPVLSSHSNYSNLLLQVLEHLDCLWTNLETYTA